MKILFIYKFDFYEPLGILTLAAGLKKAGHKCQYLDLKFEKNIEKQVTFLAPDIIAYSVITGTHVFYQKLNLKLKRLFNFVSVFGGPHCTFFPDFINEEGIDIICRGEADECFIRLADLLESGDDISHIPNVWLKNDGKIIRNEMANLKLNLDEIPFPDRDLLNNYSHYRNMKRRDVITSRGCPYNCTYCFNHANKQLYDHKGRYVRQRSVSNVIEELKILRDHYHTQTFHFQDDVFTVNRNWTIEFCNEYKKHIHLPFEVQLRIEQVDEEIIVLLAEAGCKLVMYGIESGNDTIRMDLLNRHISKDRIINTAHLFNKHKLLTTSYNIFGLPGETFENACETLQLNILCKPTYAWNSIYQPYPMTQLAEYTRSKGYYNGDMTMFQASFLYGKSLLKMKDINRIVRLHYVFSLAVNLPFAKKIIMALTRIPVLPLFRFFFWLHRVYCAFFTLKRITFTEILVFEKSKYFKVKRLW